MEIAVGATDLAESLGSAVALNLLFHIPISWAIIITAGDVLLLLALQGLGMRMIEAVVAVFVATIASVMPSRSSFSRRRSRVSWKWDKQCFNPTFVTPG